MCYTLSLSFLRRPFTVASNSSQEARNCSSAIPLVFSLVELQELLNALFLFFCVKFSANNGLCCLIQIEDMPGPLLPNS